VVRVTAPRNQPTGATVAEEKTKPERKMAEHKPKQDDQLAGDAKANKPGLSRPPGKPHGDKLKEAVEEAGKRSRKES
jgi:hypothetical protein